MRFADLASACVLAAQPLTVGTDQSADRFVRREAPFGHTITAARHSQTAMREGEAAYAAAKDVLGLTNPRFVIAGAGHGPEGWGDLTTDGAPIYPWAFRSGADGQASGPPDYILRHEIGHDLFIRYLVPSTRADQYGGDAPDWLDEMAAVAFEGEEQQADRRRAVMLYHQQGRLLPLRKFLTMTHPEMTGELPDVAAGELFRVRAVMSQDTGQFYAMTRAFYDYLVARTRNSTVVADLAAAVRRQEPLDRWILARTGQAEDGDIEGLENDFLAWIVTDPRYGESIHRGS